MANLVSSSSREKTAKPQPKDLVIKTKHRAVDEGTSLKAIVLRALVAELAHPL